jgi:preprotein translocase subunit SecB
MFNQQIHEVFVNTFLFLITPKVSIPEYHHQGVVPTLKLQPIEINRLYAQALHIKGLKCRKTESLYTSQVDI